MDEWISIDRIIEFPSKANILERKRKQNEIKQNQSLQSLSGDAAAAAGGGGGIMIITTNNKFL